MPKNHIDFSLPTNSACHIFSSRNISNDICILILSFLAYLPCNGQIDAIETLHTSIPSLPKSELSYEGMNQDTIKKLIHLIQTNPPNDFRGLVVLKNNKIIVEEYFNTFWRESIEDICSAGKGITALLLGIAIDKGLVKNTEQNVYNYFPPPKFIAPAFDEHRAIKIKHLCAMSYGLHIDDDDSSAPGNTDKWLTRNNWVNIAMGLPIIFTPGQKCVQRCLPHVGWGNRRRNIREKVSRFCMRESFCTIGH